MRLFAQAGSLCRFFFRRLKPAATKPAKNKAAAAKGKILKSENRKSPLTPLLPRGERKTEDPDVRLDGDDKPKEHCGIFGIYGHPEAARLTYFGLYALQHRGQESCGIVTGDGQRVSQHRGLGLVPEVFNKDILERLPGHLGIGHVRYSTTGSTVLINAQPFLVQHGGQSIAIAHNGTLTNAREIRCRLEDAGSIFQSTMDTEVIVHLMARHRGADVVESLINALEHVKGSYSLVIATADKVIAARDPHGFRPLCLGQLNGSWLATSETCALDLVQADYWREVEPGEIVVMDKNGLHSHKPFAPAPPKHCIFEFIYFARPDSQIFGQSVYLVRKRLGAALAREHPTQGRPGDALPGLRHLRRPGLRRGHRHPL